MSITSHAKPSQNKCQGELVTCIYPATGTLNYNYCGSTLTVVSRPYLQFRSLLRFIKSFIISATGTIKDF